MGGSSTSDLGLGDFDQDGADECVLALRNGTILVVDPSTGKVEETFDTGSAGSHSTPAVADLNRDGTMDLVTIRDGSCIAIIDGMRGEEIICWPCSGEVVATPAIRDVDRDGFDELIFGSANGALYLFTASTRD